jgi:hypothetical protein
LANGGTSAFNGISCLSATDCVAVGAGGGAGGLLFSNAAVTGFWNGKSWHLVTASLFLRTDGGSSSAVPGSGIRSARHLSFKTPKGPAPEPGKGQ